MAEQPKPIDISDVPDVLRVAEEVRRSGEPHILHGGGEDLAMVVPLPRAKNPPFKKPTAADYESFRRAVGSWADVDTDRLIEDIYRARREGTRPSNSETDGTSSGYEIVQTGACETRCSGVWTGPVQSRGLLPVIR